MTSAISSNKIIARNTIIVYTRLCITIIVGLVTSRFVLRVLGVSDFGLYNVVGSIIALYAFISGALSSTTIRFMNFEQGKEDGNMNRMFNICNLLHIVMALVILVVAEIIGVWYIHNHLNVAPGKEADAMFVFQVSIVVSCLGIVNVPFQSLFNVHENFLFPAILDIVNTILKLGFVLILLVYSGNALRFYALSMSLITLIYFIVYHVAAYRRWRDVVEWRLVREWLSYKEIISYSNYTMLQTLATTIRNQGSNLLVNFFFGTVVNAAFAVANTLQSYVVVFTGTFDGASAPQITQNIANGNIERAFYLTNTICRICILLCLIVIFPLYIEMELVLKLWLVTPPEGSVIFCKLILLVALVSSTSGGMFQFINASGNIRWFRLSVSICFLACLPLGYWAFKSGMPASTILSLFIVADIINRIIFLFLMKRILKYDILNFLQEAYIRPLIVFVILAIIALLYNPHAFNSLWIRALGDGAAILIALLLSFFIGLKSYERDRILEVLIGRWNNFIQNSMLR